MKTKFILSLLFFAASASADPVDNYALSGKKIVCGTYVLSIEEVLSNSNTKVTTYNANLRGFGGGKTTVTVTPITERVIVGKKIIAPLPATQNVFLEIKDILFSSQPKRQPEGVTAYMRTTDGKTLSERNPCQYRE